MQFHRIEPPKELKEVVECYWIATESSAAIHLQKIIPDGFPELIFHFGKPYRINLSGNWEIQSANLLAGQITKHFFLENTGASDILGVKFKPHAVTTLYSIDMSSLKDKVVDISALSEPGFHSLTNLVRSSTTHTDRIDRINRELLSVYSRSETNSAIDQCVQLIFESNGMTSVNTLCKSCGISERQMERLFKNYIGLSPKFYSRIVRFSYIFQVVQKKKISWAEVGLESGYFDQAHFIKNFKLFSGEDPGKYFFEKETMANFFLKKK